MTLRIDLNCDLGEGCGNDAELMNFISSANIACGGHAGDIDTMRRTVELAVRNNVAIGAHPGHKDRANFGRVSQELGRVEIIDLVANQIGSLQNVCDEFDTSLAHVKPHGALYNQSAKNTEIAAAIAEAVKTVDPKLILFGLASSYSISEAQRIGLRTASEVFADRTYQNDGSLTPRIEPNALITDTNMSIEHVLNMVNYGRVRSVDAVMVPVIAETVCIHGDGENAVEFANTINEVLVKNGIEICPIP
jgi:Uncharacterized proteins, homologs of lactam utilization protein B